MLNGYPPEYAFIISIIIKNFQICNQSEIFYIKFSFQYISEITLM